MNNMKETDKMEIYTLEFHNSVLRNSKMYGVIIIRFYVFSNIKSHYEKIFSMQTLVNMIWTLGECNKKCLQATRDYQKNSWIILMVRVLQVKREKKTKIVVSPENELDVQQIVRDQEISYGDVQTILSYNKLHLTTRYSDAPIIKR